MAINNYIYSDLDITFLKVPGTGDIPLKYNEQAVIRSIRNLLSTNIGERLFQPEVGSSLNSLLFEPVTQITATLIQNEVIRIITNYEPRASIARVDVSALPDSNQFNVTVYAYIGNQTSPSAINILLQRTR
jgi:phage baseplate assembly protein W